MIIYLAKQQCSYGLVTVCLTLGKHLPTLTLSNEILVQKQVCTYFVVRTPICGAKLRETMWKNVTASSLAIKEQS